jgi:hypothetical protein
MEVSREGEPFRDAKLEILRKALALTSDDRISSSPIVAAALANDAMIDIQIVRASPLPASQFGMSLVVQKRQHPEVEVSGEANAISLPRNTVTAAFHSLAPRYRLPLVEGLIAAVTGRMLKHDMTSDEQASNDVAELREIRRRIVAECCDDASAPRQNDDIL